MRGFDWANIVNSTQRLEARLDEYCEKRLLLIYESVCLAYPPVAMHALAVNKNRAGEWYCYKEEKVTGKVKPKLLSLSTYVQQDETLMNAMYV